MNHFRIPIKVISKVVKKSNPIISLVLGIGSILLATIAEEGINHILRKKIHKKQVKDIINESNKKTPL